MFSTRIVFHGLVFLRLLVLELTKPSVCCTFRIIVASQRDIPTNVSSGKQSHASYCRVSYQAQIKLLLRAGNDFFLPERVFFLKKEPFEQLPQANTVL